MKDIFKISSFALAIVALASCSNDDLLISENNATAGGKNALAVSVEALKESNLPTRAMSAGNEISITWETSDKIKVYDKDLHIWDGYQFNGTAFTLFTSQDLTEPKFALYPFGEGEKDASIDHDYANGGVISTSWSKGGKTSATFFIPGKMTKDDIELADGQYHYSEDAEKDAYWCSLPMWGTVESTAGNLKTNLNWLTAILRVKLENLAGNAETLEIRAFEDPNETKAFQLTGEFTAQLFSDDVEKTEIASTASASTNDVLSIDISDAKLAHSVVYVPVPVMKSAIVKLYLKKGDKYIQLNEKGQLEATSETSWKGHEYKVLSQKNYERAHVYGVSEAKFAVSGATINELNGVLAGMAASQDDIIITAEADNTSASTNDGYTLYIPALTEKKLVLDLNKLTVETGKTLVIMSKDINKPFTGTLELIVNKDVKANIEVNLPKANVQLVGNYYTESPTCTYDVIAKGIFIGDVDSERTTYVKLNKIGEEVEVIDVAANAKYGKELILAGNEKATVITVEGTVTGRIDASAVKGSTITISGEASASVSTIVDGNITVKDEAEAGWLQSNNGNIEVKDKAKVESCNAVEGYVLIGVAGGNSEVEIGGSISAKGNVRVFTIIPVSGSIANVTSTDGYVTLKDADYSGVANSTITAATYVCLLQNAKAKDITLAEGGDYVEVNVSAQDGDCEAVLGSVTLCDGAELKLNQGYVRKVVAPKGENEKAELKHGGNAAYTAIMEVEGNLKSSGVSKWNGEGLPKKEYKNPSNIWTASQLASIDPENGSKNNFKLMSNIDLDENEWTPKSLVAGKSFDGNGYKIAKGKVKADEGYAGLFSTVAGNVSNLIIDGLSVTAIQGDKKQLDALGILAGKATGGIISKVTVIGSVESDQLGVGGLIGEIDGDVTIQGDEETPTNVTATIKGANNLGGLVGRVVKGTLTISNYKTTATFALSEAPKTGRNMTCGTIAPFVGTAEYGTTINLDAEDAGYKATSELNTTGLYFDRNFVISTTDNNTFYYFRGSKLVGYCPNESKDVPAFSATDTEESNPTTAKAGKKDEEKSGFSFVAKGDVSKAKNLNVYEHE